MPIRLSPEDVIQRDYFSFLRKWGEKFPVLLSIFAIPNGSNKTFAEAYVFKETGLKPGVWDVLVPVYRHAWDKHRPGFWVEFKQPGKYLQPNQKDFRDITIIPNDYAYGVYRSWHEAAKDTLHYLGIHDEDATKELQEAAHAAVQKHEKTKRSGLGRSVATQRGGKPYGRSDRRVQKRPR